MPWKRRRTARKLSLEKLSASVIDVIITDLMMPLMDGSQLLQELHARGHDSCNCPHQFRAASIKPSLSSRIFALSGTWKAWLQLTAIAPLLERAIRQKKLLNETERLRRQLGYQGVLEDLVGTSWSRCGLFFPPFSSRRQARLP